MRGVVGEATSSMIEVFCWKQVEGNLFLFVLFQVRGIQCGVVVLSMRKSMRRRRKWGANEHGPKK
jgi:hypothetical protein